MTSFRAVPFALILALLLLAGLGSAAGGQPGAWCSPGGTETLAASPQARLYRGAVPLSAQGNAGPVYGCLKSSGKTRRLGPRKGGGLSISGPFSLKATWAGAVENQRAGTSSARVYAVARDIQAGPVRHCLVGSADKAGRLPVVRVLLIDPRAGALAWAAITPSPTGRAPLIGVCDSSGNRVLDSGAGVEVETLKLQGSTLSWVNAGGPRSAQLH